VAVIFATVAALFGSLQAPVGAAQKDEKKDAKTAPVEPAKLTPAAEETFAKLLKAKVSAEFKEARLGDVLKEFAHQVETKTDAPVMWAYGKDFPFAQKVTFSCKDKPLEVALDELFKKQGGLGYVVVSKDGDRRDGWVLVTTTGERGYEKGSEPPPKATAEEEADATDKLALAKKLLDGGKNEQAKTVLTFIVKRYPGAKAAGEARELLGKLK
jgi:hypothetical protein